MPEITDEEMKKFKELIEKDKQREKEDKVRKEIYIDKLSENVDILLDLNKSYGPIEAYALTFANFLKNDFKAHETDVLWFSWSEIQRYVTEKCLERDQKGNLMLNNSFRQHLLSRGFKTRVNRQYDTFKVEKCQPRKRRKKR